MADLVKNAKADQISMLSEHLKEHSSSHDSEICDTVGNMPAPSSVSVSEMENYKKEPVEE